MSIDVIKKKMKKCQPSSLEKKKHTRLENSFDSFLLNELDASTKWQSKNFAET